MILREFMWHVRNWVEFNDSKKDHQADMTKIPNLVVMYFRRIVAKASQVQTDIVNKNSRLSLLKKF